MNVSISAHFNDAIAAFDAANNEDPNLENDNGLMTARELLYARRLSDWVDKLEPHASEALRLAARCQHLCRWMIPRSDYPEGRAGYLKWRSTLAVFHANKAAEILKTAGYGEDTTKQVQNINLKKNLRKEPEVQVMEDALCLVFLQYQVGEFAEKHDDEMVSNIIRKTWNKMSERGHNEAMKLDYSQRVQRLLQTALALKII